MLDTTLTTEFIPGSNLKGSVAGANWSFLLPSLELERIICIGAPSTAALATLSRIGQAVVVVCHSRQQVEQVSAASQQYGLANIKLIRADAHTALPLLDREVDLAFIAGSSGARSLKRNPVLQRELRRLFKPDGLIYCELAGFVRRLASNSALGKFMGDFEAPRLFWLTPRCGEMHTAVPLHDEATISYFAQHGFYSPPIELPAFKRVERFFNKRLLFSRFTQRYGVLMERIATSPMGGPPQYLQSIAQNMGIDIDSHRWGLVARGEYMHQKVLFFLFAPESGAPEYVVKLTRAPAFNARLENEYCALSLLCEQGIGDKETLPQAVFFGHHGDLAIIGETVIDGVPFRQRTKATANCPYARAAIDWLFDLGVATADHMAARPWQVAEGLEVLFKRFGQIYQLAPEQHDFLAEQIATIARSCTTFPLVFQHGDPGTWNVMITPSGRAAFLDWEASEPQGMPLWDLFYFMRSYSIWVARARGTRNRMRGFEQQFLAESALSPFLIEVIERYCDQIGLPREMIEPLFYTCWMHRAIKEATRLSATKLESGHYINLLRLCIEQRNTPTLRRLFRCHTGC